MIWVFCIQAPADQTTSFEMKAIVLVVIFAVLNKLTTAMVKKNIYINVAMTWNQAQAHCRANYKDLSTITSEVEYDIFRIDIDSSGNDGWIGLINSGYGWYWSDGSRTNYQRWTKVPANKIKCAIIKSSDGNWDQHNCDETRPFYCYDWIPGITLIRIKMSWENALIYCRTYYSDLAILNTTRSLLDVKNKTNTTVWTGLRFLAGSWFWVTRDPLELQDPLHSCPTEPYRCGARNPEADRWENRDCEEELIFLCNDNIK